MNFDQRPCICRRKSVEKGCITGSRRVLPRSVWPQRSSRFLLSGIETKDLVMLGSMDSMGGMGGAAGIKEVQRQTQQQVVNDKGPIEIRGTAGLLMRSKFPSLRGSSV